MSTNLSPSDVATILRLHNDFRAANGIGPLQWSDTVSTQAVEWATHSATFPQCVDTASPHGGYGPYGQNLAWCFGGAGFPIGSLYGVDALVNSWNAEAIPTIPVGSGPNSYNHASQVLWGATTSVGCARGYGDGCEMLVCEYDPPGNMVGQQWNTVGGQLITASTSQIIGVGTDNLLYSKNGLNGGWSKIAGAPGKLIDLIYVSGGFVGIAPDNSMWSTTSISGSWTMAPNSGQLKSIAVFADKTTYVGVGMDNLLYSRVGLTGTWVLIPNSGSVFDVTVLADGRILGVGLDNQLYTKASLTANWQLIPNSGVVTRTAQQPDGSILGVGKDKTLWKMQTLGSSWVSVPNSCCVLSVVSY